MNDTYTPPVIYERDGIEYYQKTITDADGIEEIIEVEVEW